MKPFRSTLRAWTHRYVIALGVALVLTAGTIVGANVVIDSKFDQLDRVEVELQPADPGVPGNFLLIGSDSRAFETTAKEAAAFGSKEVQTGQRSDTIMVVHVEPESRTSIVVSFPRDLWVDIPGIGESKINAAFNEGPQKVVDTLQTNFGIPINHYVEVDFATFAGIVDAVGRVPVLVPAKARDEKSGFAVPHAGCYQLDGDQALQYVRSRGLEYYDSETGRWSDADPIPDLGRIARQQDFIRRIGSLAYRAALGNPLKANEIADDVIPKLRVDTQLSRADVFKLVNTFRTVDPADPNAVEMITLPTYGTTSSDGQSILLPDEPDATQVIAKLKTFEPPPAPPKGILPAQVHVRVLNGSGATGLAASTLDTLQRQYGFAGAGLGNADELEKTEVRYRPGLEKAANLVAGYLPGTRTLVEDPAIAQADVVVVLGSDFGGVSAPAGVTPASTVPTTTAAPPDVSELSPKGVTTEEAERIKNFLRGVQQAIEEAGCVER